jgi:hypothetical protein
MILDRIRIVKRAHKRELFPREKICRRHHPMVPGAVCVNQIKPILRPDLHSKRNVPGKTDRREPPPEIESIKRLDAVLPAVTRKKTVARTCHKRTMAKAKQMTGKNMYVNPLAASVTMKV